MFKRFIRWTLPLIVLMLIAMYLVAFSPVLASHAATPVTNHQAPEHVIQLHSHDDPKQQNQAPNMFWRP